MRNEWMHRATGRHLQEDVPALQNRLLFNVPLP